MDNELTRYLFEKAKEMEKRQIIGAFNEGLVEKKPDDYCGYQKSDEEYYNETFKSE